MRCAAIPMLLALFCATGASGQAWLGFANSSYGGMHTAFHNPAMLANTHLAMQFGIPSADVGITNNYLRYRSGVRGSDIRQLFRFGGNTYDGVRKKDITEVLADYFGGNRFEQVYDGNSKNLNISGEFRGPSVMLAIPMGGIGIYYRARAAMQVRDVDQEMARLIFNGFKYNGVSDAASIIDSKFSIGLNAYHELGASLGMRAGRIGHHYFSAGATVKYLAGIYALNVVNRGLSLQIIDKDNLISLSSEVGYNYLDGRYLDDSDGLLPKPVGHGMGVDFGGVWEYRPLDDGESNAPGYGHHKARIGVSVVDLGFINYSSAKYVRSLDVAKRNQSIYWGRIDTVDIKSPAGLDSILTGVFSLPASKTKFQTGLPTVVNIQGEYQLYKGLYIGANLTTSLRAKARSGLRAFSNIVLIPRYESNLFEFALPTGLGLAGKAFQMGMFFRFSGFFVGSDNITSFFGSSLGNSGFNMYVGGFVPIRKRTPLATPKVW